MYPTTHDHPNYTNTKLTIMHKKDISTIYHKIIKLATI